MRLMGMDMIGLIVWESQFVSLTVLQSTHWTEVKKRPAFSLKRAMRVPIS